MTAPSVMGKISGIITTQEFYLILRPQHLTNFLHWDSNIPAKMGLSSKVFLGFVDSISWSRGFLPFIIMDLLFGCMHKVLVILCRLSNILIIKLFRRFVVGLQSPSSYRRLYALSIAITIKRNEDTGMWKQPNQFLPDIIPLIGIQAHIQNTAPSPPIL